MEAKHKKIETLLCLVNPGTTLGLLRVDKEQKEIARARERYSIEGSFSQLFNLNFQTHSTRDDILEAIQRCNIFSRAS